MDSGVRTGPERRSCLTTPHPPLSFCPFLLTKERLDTGVFMNLWILHPLFGLKCHSPKDCAHTCLCHLLSFFLPWFFSTHVNFPGCRKATEHCEELNGLFQKSSDSAAHCSPQMKDLKKSQAAQNSSLPLLIFPLNAK